MFQCMLFAGETLDRQDFFLLLFAQVATGPLALAPSYQTRPSPMRTLTVRRS
jgi:hypothetical protein